MRTAVFDPFAFGASELTDAFAMTKAAGASYVRIVADWSSLAPGEPAPSFVASDPNSPGYSWSRLDTTIAAAEASGLTPILDIGHAPAWALTTPAQGVDGGTPSVPALGAFATALASHYNGSSGAPPVHIFEVWNEPNVSIYLAPVSPTTYRSMVNAVASAVHAVDSANLVVAGDLDPFGHPKSHKQKWYSVTPLAFMRSMLCLSQGKHPHATCRTPAHFDVWSHHPYTFGGAFGHAKNPDDVELGDLPRMRALLQAAVRLRRVVSAHPVQFWVTEFGWDSSPPRPHAAPLALAARWTAESLYQMWRSGVSLVTWFDLQDEASPSHYQSGLYFYSKSLADARAKPVRTAFRFPFVAYREKGGVSLWGRDATSSRTFVTIQRRAGSRGVWRSVARIRTNRYGIFLGKLRLAAGARDWMRALAPGSGNSLAFSLTRPSPKVHFGPWGN